MAEFTFMSPSSAFAVELLMYAFALLVKFSTSTEPPIPNFDLISSLAEPPFIKPLISSIRKSTLPAPL